jgi:hypothetical protein
MLQPQATVRVLGQQQDGGELILAGGAGEPALRQREQVVDRPGGEVMLRPDAPDRRPDPAMGTPRKSASPFIRFVQ